MLKFRRTYSFCLVVLTGRDLVCIFMSNLFNSTVSLVDLWLHIIFLLQLQSHAVSLPLSGAALPQSMMSPSFLTSQ